MPDLGALLHSFFVDDKLKLVLALIALDFILGVSSALRRGTFDLSYVARFAHDDLLGKVFPWFVLYAADKVASASILGVDAIAVAAGATFVTVTAALAGSIKDSIQELVAPPPAQRSA